MNMEPIINNPIKIKLSSTKNIILSDDGIKENYPLIPGAVIDGEHYGFELAVGEEEDHYIVTSYPTQCTITAIGIRNDKLKIYEDGKSIPWEFDLQGQLESWATFSEYSRRDRDYLVVHLEYFDEEQLEKVNTYRKR